MLIRKIPSLLLCSAGCGARLRVSAKEGCGPHGPKAAINAEIQTPICFCKKAVL